MSATYTVERFIPDGWQLLPAGIARTIRGNTTYINGDRADDDGAMPICIDSVDYWDAQVLGPCEFLFARGDSLCGTAGYLRLVTRAAILVKVDKDADDEGDD